MTYTLLPINLKDAAGTTQPCVSYTDGVNNALAHPLLDNTGAIIAPATAGNQAAGNTSLAAIATNTTGVATASNQTTSNTSLATIATAVQAATPAGTNLIGKVGIDQTTPGTTNGVQINGALPTGTNSIGTVTANAGTNLNTSALSLDTSVNGILVAQGSATSGQKGPLIQAAVSSTAPSLTTAQTSPLSLDTAGNLRVNVVAGGAAGGTSSGFAAAFPSTGTALGAKNGANMVNLTADGSGNLNVNLQTALPTGANLIGATNLYIGGATHSASNPLFIEDAYLAPVAATWNNATAANTAQTVTTSGMDTVIVSCVPSGTITAGNIIFEAFDGATWLPIKAARIESYNTEGSYALTGTTRGWQIPVAGFPQFRVRLNTAITGTGSATITTIVSSAPDTSVVTVGIDPQSTVPLPTGAATAANQATEITSLASIATSVAANATAANQATEISTLASILTATQAPTPAGSNLIGSVSMTANTASGTSTYSATGGTGNALLTNTAVAVKASAGNLYGVSLVNTGAAAAYVQFFDALTGSVTLGTTAPKLSFWVPAGGSWEEKFTGEAKVSFATAITAAATTTATGLTAPAVGILANIVYK